MTTPFWRKIHQTVSGHSRNITDEIVGEILNLSQNEIVDGLTHYKPFTKELDENWMRTSTCSNCLKEFVHELSQELRLDTKIGYAVMCNFLMFEYHGKIKEFWQITRIGTTVRIREIIWNFYTAERMFLLKTIRHVMELAADTSCEFTGQYNLFLQDANKDDIQQSLISQYESLVGEITPTNCCETTSYASNWISRNTREQIELLLILNLTTIKLPFSTEQICNLIKVLIQYNFNTHPVYYELSTLGNMKDTEDLKDAQIGFFLVLLYNQWERDNTDFWADEAVIEIDKLITALHENAGQTVVILAWLLFKSKTVDLGAEEARISELLRNKPFQTLYGMVTNKIFKDCFAGDVVLKATHRMADEFALVYDNRTSLYEQPGVIPLLAEFLTNSDLVPICLARRNGLDVLLEITVDTFPYDFFQFSAITKSLLGHKDHYKQAIQMLNNVPTFLSEMQWARANKQISILKNPQRAFMDSNLIVFPANTIVRSYSIHGKNLVQYKAPYCYFLHLEYVVNLMIESAMVLHRFEELLVDKVIAGYNVVIQAVKHCKDMDLELIGLKRIIKRLDKIMPLLDGPMLNLRLVKLYFDVHNAMMLYRGSNFYNMCPEVVWKMYFPKLTGVKRVQDSNRLLLNQFIFDNTLFMRIFKEEELNHDHTVVLTYIETLHTIFKVKLEYKVHQLAGIAYILNFVFLQHQSWIYIQENQKTKITLACLNIFHLILQRDRLMLSKDEQRIFELCHHAFLKDAYVIEAFLKLFIKDRFELVFLMERESNWLKGTSLDTLQCIRMQLALLLVIMDHKKALGEECTLDDKLCHIVKPVASYFTNSYSAIIAQLSCRFLEKLAQDSTIPLLALLELDHYQVQSLFLECLRDPLEEENVKIAIIDLINTCIANQNGMTAAFFNLKCFMYWDGTDNDVFTGDTVSDFMVDYLQNIKRSHEYFKHPLQIGILRLLYNLWNCHRENLIDGIAHLKEFWPVMIDPFFCDFVQCVEIYTVILRIINLEIGANADNVEKKLIETINKFVTDRTQLLKWNEFLLRATSYQTPGHTDLLNAWMEFLCLTKKVMPNSFDTLTRKAIIMTCLDGLTSPLSGFNNIEVVNLWAQLYFMLICSWFVHDEDEIMIIRKLTQFLNSLRSYFRRLPPKIKETTLGIVHKTIINLTTYLEGNIIALMHLLAPVGVLVDMEHDFLISEVWGTKDQDERIKLLSPWLIIIFMANSLLALKNVAQISQWFNYRSFLPKVIATVGRLLSNRSLIPFAKIAIDHMISYASSPLAKDFLNIDLFDFYYSVRPPALTLHLGDCILEGVPVNLKEWWLVFICLIRLNRVLIKNLGADVLPCCFTFLSQHDQPLKEIISLTKCTVDMTALTLVCESLKFMHTLLVLVPNWTTRAPRSCELIMDGIKTTVNACVLSLLGSKKINFYNILHGKVLDVIEQVPVELLSTVLNKITEITYWSFSCFIKSRPDLIQLLYADEFTDTLYPIVANDFSVPRFEIPQNAKLTYGMLMGLAHYLCKTLSQLSPNTPVAAATLRNVTMTGLNDCIKIKSLEKIFEHCTANYEKVIGFMVYLQRSNDMPNEKISSFLHYDMSEFTGSSPPATSRMDYHLVKSALETLMNFLAGEILIMMRHLDGDALFTYKRELSSEMQFFYEFVRKRTSEQCGVMSVPRVIELPCNETDIIKRYMVAKMKGNISTVADDNYMLIISQWLVKFCELSN